MHADLEGKLKMTSGQGDVRPRDEPGRSRCIISRGVYAREHIGTIPSALSVFYQKLETKTYFTSYEVERPEGQVIGLKLHTGYRQWPII